MPWASIALNYELCIVVGNGVALSCVELQCSCQWGPPAGRNEADECICHTDAAAPSWLAINKPVGRVRQFNFLAVQDSSIGDLVSQ